MNVCRKKCILLTITGAFLLFFVSAKVFGGQSRRDGHSKVKSKRSSPVKSISQEKELLDLCRSLDTTPDGQITTKELIWAIQKRMKVHMQKSIRSNMKDFFALDKLNPNGQVAWSEWLERFNSQFSSDFQSSRSYKEKLSAAKAAWSEAARSHPDQLNIDEFMAFNHPELSQPLVVQDVEVLLNMYDVNRDGSLSKEEALEAAVFKQESNVVELDVSGDGLLDRRELLAFFDPKTEAWAKERSRDLIRSLDESGDGTLQCKELLSAEEEDLKILWPQQYFHSIF